MGLHGLYRDSFALPLYNGNNVATNSELEEWFLALARFADAVLTIL
jgi:hypothetical protein